MFDDNKKENRRKHLNNKKKDSFKKRICEDEDLSHKKKSIKNSLRDARADEIWEEWENQDEN